LQIEFRNKHLLELYETGKSRKYCLDKSIIKKFFMRIAQLEGAPDISDLWKTPALNFERLHGFENRYSVGLNIKFRLEIEMEWEDMNKTRGKVRIEEISPHYGD
jgi:plasmid maintenance system killer protein